MGGLVRHDFPEPLRTRERPRAEFDAPGSAHQASQGPAEARVERDADVGERRRLPQPSELPQDALGSAGVGSGESPGRGRVHVR